MFGKIMIPVDLQHVEKIELSLKIAAELAERYDAVLYYVGVAGRVPSRAARSPEQFERELRAFAEAQGEKFGIRTDSKTMHSTDVPVELIDRLLEAQEEIGADLIVMASHVPGVPDRLHLIPSNSAKVVRRANCSVFVVR